jgi:hypothetical protein
MSSIIAGKISLIKNIPYSLADQAKIISKHKSTSKPVLSLLFCSKFQFFKINPF